MRKLRLYFGCALAGLPVEHRERMIELRTTLSDHFEVLEFCPATTPPREIYQHDIHYCVATADLMLAVCDNPSTGLGYEMATMVEKLGKPALGVAHTTALVSSLIRGITKDCFELRRYEDPEEILAMLLDFTERHFSERSQLELQICLPSPV